MRRCQRRLVLAVTVYVGILQVILIYGGQALFKHSIDSNRQEQLYEDSGITKYMISPNITQHHYSKSSLKQLLKRGSGKPSRETKMPKKQVGSEFISKLNSRDLGLDYFPNRTYKNRDIEENPTKDLYSDIPFSHKRKSTDYWKHKFVNDYTTGVKDGKYLPMWQSDLFNRIRNDTLKKSKFFLSHLLMVRLYDSDFAKWTIRELKQWLHYMFLAGVEHVYICDHFHEGDDNLADLLEQYIELELVSYVRIFTKVAMTAQKECYVSLVKQNGDKSEWMTSVDMDEYPFHMSDGKEGFLQRYLQYILDKFPYVGEVSMSNFLMLGQGDRNKAMVLERIQRSTPGPANHLVKPLFRPRHVIPDIHHGTILGIMRSMNADPQTLRMLHYWGARLQNWGPDSDELYRRTHPFKHMATTWVDRLRGSLLNFGEIDAFSTKSGP